MNRISSLVAPAGLLFLLACAPKVTRPATTASREAGEDLSAFRPRYNPATVAPTSAPSPKKEVPTEKRPASPRASDQPLHVNRRLDMVLDTLAQRNRYVKHVRGYRIQLYVGTNRQEADGVKVYVYQNFPELNVYLTYSAPTYRLRTGDFVARLDVERYFDSMQVQYPNAMILTDKVEIRKSLAIK